MHQANCTLAVATSTSDPSPSDVLLDGTNTFDETFDSSPVYVADAESWSMIITAPSDGSPAGTFTVEVCNQGNAAIERPNSLLTQWVPISFLDSSGVLVDEKAFSGAIAEIFSDAGCAYRWVRLAVDIDSGDLTTPLVTFQKKGR